MNHQSINLSQLTRQESDVECSREGDSCCILHLSKKVIASITVHVL